MFLNNRYHDPTLGTFISVDPLVEATGEPYIYASGNPTTLSDPSGLCAVAHHDGETCAEAIARSRPSIDPQANCSGDAVERVVCGADKLINLGQDGRDYRDAANDRVTNIALDAARLANGTCFHQASGLIVCVVDNGIDLAMDDVLRILAGADDMVNTPLGDIPIPDVDLPIGFKGGTTYGNVFITQDFDDLGDADLLAHELIHTYQWAAAGDIRDIGSQGGVMVSSRVQLGRPA